MSREGVQVPPGEFTQIGNWGVPLCKRDLQSFIGVLNFHRDHIPKFALVAKPLYQCRTGIKGPGRELFDGGPILNNIELWGPCWTLVIH